MMEFFNLKKEKQIIPLLPVDYDIFFIIKFSNLKALVKFELYN